MAILKRIVRKLKRIITNEKDPREELLNLMPKNSTCAEIGVWKGGFSKRIIKHVVPSKLHLIDPWKYQTSFGKRWYGGLVAQSQEDMDNIYQQVVGELSKQSCIKIHREFSNKLFSIFSDEYFDWVYVDGNHYYDYVLEDLKNFALKIKKNGFLTGDDYLWTSPELNGDKPVTRAVNDFINEDKSFTLFKIIGDQFILKKCVQ
jgi:Methyltransferase domain